MTKGQKSLFKASQVASDESVWAPYKRGCRGIPTIPGYMRYLITAIKAFAAGRSDSFTPAQVAELPEFKAVLAARKPRAVAIFEARCSLGAMLKAKEIVKKRRALAAGAAASVKRSKPAPPAAAAASARVAGGKRGRE